MTVAYLVDEKANKTAVQLSIEDYLLLLENANLLPEYVKEGISKGRKEGASGLTKSTAEVMQKYNLWG